MNVKSNKGFSGIDISIAIIIILIFVALITSLFYNFTIASKKVNRKSEATYLAVQITENIKAMNYEDITEDTNGGIDVNKVAEKSGQTIDVAKGYTVTISVQNYNERQNNAELEDVIKIVTVKVEYTVGKSTENVELSTAITKE